MFVFRGGCTGDEFSKIWTKALKRTSQNNRVSERQNDEYYGHNDDANYGDEDDNDDDDDDDDDDGNGPERKEKNREKRE